MKPNSALSIVPNSPMGIRLSQPLSDELNILSWSAKMISEHTFSPRELGAIAYFEGKEVIDNPFSPLVIEHDDWFEGYADEVSFVSDIFDNCFGAPLGSA